MTEKILFVDDDELILASWERSLRRQFDVETALGPKQAIEKIQSFGPYGVVVSDMRMPEMNGLQLLERVRELSPDTVRLILTGNADIRTAIDAVNQGHIFRFLEKPCPIEVLGKVLTVALEQHRLQKSEQELLEKTLHGSVKVLTEVLGLVHPEAFSMASRITVFVKHIAAELKLQDSWRFEMAAMLSQLGSVVLPTDTLEAVRMGRKLSPDQRARFVSHPDVARNLIRSIPRMESVAAMIAHQMKPFKEQPQISIAERDDETLGAQMLKVCIKFEAEMREGRGHVGAIAVLQEDPGEYDPALVAVLSSLPADVLPCEPQVVEVADLQVKMVLDQDLRTKEGTLLVAKGIEITDTLLTRIQNFHHRGSVGDSIRVLVPISFQTWLKNTAPAQAERFRS